jgi:quinol monooxygenase YgiN
MAIARHYRMDAAEGKGEELASALAALASALNGVPGFEGADLLHDVDHPSRLIFIEKWSSIEAHKQSASSLPKDAFANVMASVVGKPDACYLCYLHLA